MDLLAGLNCQLDLKYSLGLYWLSSCSGRRVSLFLKKKVLRTSLQYLSIVDSILFEDDLDWRQKLEPKPSRDLIPEGRGSL